MSAVSCRQSVQKSDQTTDNVSLPNLTKVHVLGKVALPDSSRVVINTDENTMQPLLTAYVLNGAFDLEGELEEPNFYNLVVGKEKFKVYLENDKQYKFSAQVVQGKVRDGRVESDSKTMQDYSQMIKVLSEKESQLRQQESSLRASLNNPNSYQSAVEKSAALTVEREEYPQRLKMQYITDSTIAPPLKLFLIKDENINRANYELYYNVLMTTPDPFKGISLFRQAEAKVAHVRDFFENMPIFPDIHPRNIVGDSLILADLKKEGTILFVFWGSWNREAKSDIRLIQSNTVALEKLHITPVFLTWEKDFDAWEKVSKTLGLGRHNYRLNVADQEFVVNNYAVRKLPHYMLVNAADLSVINYYFTFPLDGKLVNKLKNENLSIGD